MECYINCSLISPVFLCKIALQLSFHIAKFLLQTVSTTDASNKSQFNFSTIATIADNENNNVCLDAHELFAIKKLFCVGNWVIILVICGSIHTKINSSYLSELTVDILYHICYVCFISWDVTWLLKKFVVFHNCF